ncbi:uncharacterized protein LOC135401003 isoform X2 [Ornithodoros turicata]|uniref:uncharacterized protein LOC135401003 isoform X2 n=1 Tax=Ornithodoros turicata TaxID=34597 RepID=UPI00313977A9
MDRWSGNTWVTCGHLGCRCRCGRCGCLAAWPGCQTGQTAEAIVGLSAVSGAVRLKHRKTLIMRPKDIVVRQPAVADGTLVWAIDEKERLLTALKKHGTADLERLAAEVGTRDAVAVKGFLDVRRSQLRRTAYPVKSDPVYTYLHNWQMYMHRAKNPKWRTTDRAQIFTEVVATCAEKDFPQPAHDLEPNFGELYHYLADVMQDTVKQMDLEAEKHALQCAVTHVENISVLGKSTANAQVTAESSKDAGNSDEVDPSPKTKPALTVMAEDDLSRRSESFHGQPRFPPWKTRVNNVSATWNPLQIAPDVLHQEHAHITSMWFN